MPLGDGKLASRILSGVVEKVVDRALMGPTVQIEPKDVLHATEAVVDALDKVPGVAVVEVKNEWMSKTVWTSILAIVAMIGTRFGFDLSPQTQADILAAIIPILGVATFIYKKWFTPTVTASSVGKA